MSKYQYILECDLPPLATAEEIALIKNACDQRSTASLGYSAKKAIALWAIPEALLRGDIIRHIKAGKRMFHKYKDGRSGELIPNDVQANISLSAGFDAYVEVALMDKGMVILYAHDHTPGKLLLPQ